MRSNRRDEVLQALREAAAPLGVAELADQLGVHVNTVRFHLDSLVQEGRVERSTVPASTPGRPRQEYRAIPGMDPHGARHYRALAQVLIEAFDGLPDAARRAVEAGRRWGAEEARAGSKQPVNELVAVLDDLGFAPQRDGRRIGLRSCPFLELADDHRDVVCSVHLGLMQGALEGTDTTVERLDPFVEPDLCLAHLTPSGAA